MGRRRKEKKLHLTTISVYEDFVEEEKMHKPRSCTWADHLQRSFRQLRSLKDENYFLKKDNESLKEDRDINVFYFTKEMEKNAKYENLIQRLSFINNHDLQMILNPLRSSDGSLVIAKYTVMTNHQMNFHKEVIRET